MSVIQSKLTIPIRLDHFLGHYAIIGPSENNPSMEVLDYFGKLCQKLPDFPFNGLSDGWSQIVDGHKLFVFGGESPDLAHDSSKNSN